MVCQAQAPEQPTPGLHDIRQAGHADVSGVEQLIRHAYTKYVARLGGPPGPMLDDYPARIRQGTVWVAGPTGALAGLVVLLPKEDHLLLDNVAVDPASQGHGVGRALMEFALARAASEGFSEMRLYTHALMHENIALYARTGWTETGRHTEAGFDRVFFRRSVV